MEDADERHDEETLDQIIKAKTFLQTYHSPGPLGNMGMDAALGKERTEPGTPQSDEQSVTAGVGLSNSSLEMQPASSSLGPAPQQAHDRDSAMFPTET